MDGENESGRKKSRMQFVLVLQAALTETIAQGKDYLLRAPDRLHAAKVTFVIAVLAVPFLLLNKPFIGVSLALGALAGALSETDDHPKGRVEALVAKTSYNFV